MKIGKMEIKLLILDECYLEGKKNQLNNCYNGKKTKWQGRKLIYRIQQLPYILHETTTKLYVERKDSYTTAIKNIKYLARNLERNE